MKIKTFSYRFAEEILENEKYKEFYNEIIWVCKSVPIPICNDKSEKQKKLNVVQQILNTFIKLKFVGLWWEQEPFATPDTNEDSLRSDFKKVFTYDWNKKLQIQIEVEFWNIASSYRNYIKFQLSFSYNLADICILILPCNDLSVRIDSWVASFEKTIREIPSAKLSITVPILVIWLDDSDKSYNWDTVEDYCKFKNKPLPLSDLDKKEMLEILKWPKNKYSQEHNKFVQNYIDRQNKN